jgi:hypothetical protein
MMHPKVVFVRSHILHGRIISRNHRSTEWKNEKGRRAVKFAWLAAPGSPRHDVANQQITAAGQCESSREDEG